MGKKREYRVNEEKVVDLIGAKEGQSAVLDDLLASPNPEYQATVVNLLPFDERVEMIGKTAGRIYFRTTNKVYALNMSDMSMQRLHCMLGEALAS